MSLKGIGFTARRATNCSTDPDRKLCESLNCSVFKTELKSVAFASYATPPFSNGGGGRIRTYIVFVCKTVRSHCFLMRTRGFEPPLSCENQALNLARLPFRHVRVGKSELVKEQKLLLQKIKHLLVTLAKLSQLVKPRLVLDLKHHRRSFLLQCLANDSLKCHSFQLTGSHGLLKQRTCSPSIQQLGNV